MNRYSVRLYLSLILIISTILVAGCFSGGDVSTTNNPPIANAGDPQTISREQLVTLDGSDSYDVDKDSLTYRWSQVSGTPITLNDPASVKPTFNSPDRGEMSSSDWSSMTADLIQHLTKSPSASPMSTRKS